MNNSINGCRGSIRRGYIRPPRLSSSFSKSGRSAKKRFLNILDRRRKRTGYVPAAAAVICSAVLGGCFTAAAVPSEPVSMLMLGSDESRVRNDIILLCTLDEGLSITQLPRDTYAGGDKLGNMGTEQLSEAVSAITGIYTDNYVSVDCEGLRNIIDAAGGVDFSVPVDMDYDDPYQGLSIDLDAGMQHLDGAGAEMVMRYRKSNVDESTGAYYGYDRGDLDRLDVQRSLYYALSDKLVNDGVSAELAAAVTDNIETNLSPADVAGLIKRAAGLDREDISIDVLGGTMRNDIYSGTVYVPE